MEEESEQIVQKVSAKSISILDHVFTFDSVANTDSTQVQLLCGFLPFVSSSLWLIIKSDKEVLLFVQLHVNIIPTFFFFFPFYFKQQDIFELVGVPLVENCLAGFNSSIFAYGQVVKLSDAKPCH